MDLLKVESRDVCYYLATRKLTTRSIPTSCIVTMKQRTPYPVMFENNNPWRYIYGTEMVEELTTNVQLIIIKRLGNHNVVAKVGLNRLKRR